MAVGVGLCALALLALASIAPTIDARSARSAVATPLTSGSDTGFLFDRVDTEIGGHVIHGFLLQGSGNAAADVAPPGVDHFPRPGEAFVSPALAQLLDLREQEALRQIVGARPAGVIDVETLAGESDLTFYQGVSTLTNWGQYADRWGQPASEQPLDPQLWTVLITGTIVVLVPLLLFTALASRIGSARRDRRDTVLQLLGASRHQLRMLVTVEALVASVLGLAIGAAAFWGSEGWRPVWSSMGMACGPPTSPPAGRRFCSSRWERCCSE